MSCDLERKPVCHFQTRYLHIISFLFTFTKRNITSASLACAGQKEDSVDTLFPTAGVICTMPLYKYATKFQ